MKVTIQVPEELYRKVKAKTAAQGRRVREVSIELFENWVNEDGAGPREESAEQWLTAWFAKVDAGPGKDSTDKYSTEMTAREDLGQDRSRLDK